MQITKQNWLATLINFAVTLFFLSIFIVKGGYNAAPALLMLIGLGYGVYALIKRPLLNLSKVDKWLIYSYLFYFLTFVLSLCINGGKMRDLGSDHLLLYSVGHMIRGVTSCFTFIIKISHQNLCIELLYPPWWYCFCLHRAL